MHFDVSGYALRCGSTLDRALLVQYMQRTYREFHPDQDVAHLAETVDRYLSVDTPLWWVEMANIESSDSSASALTPQTVACLWIGNAVDQVTNDRHAHIFLLYVAPNHRRFGIGSSLMRCAEAWAKTRGDRQIGLQVFQFNQPALQLYQKLGYQAQSIWMVKPL